VATQVLQPAPLQPVQQDAEGRLLPVQTGAAMDRQKWQLMAKASGWTQGEVLLLKTWLQVCDAQPVATSDSCATGVAATCWVAAGSCVQRLKAHACNMPSVSAGHTYGSMASKVLAGCRS
jgi:hypothetical protein